MIGEVGDVASHLCILGGGGYLVDHHHHQFHHHHHQDYHSHHHKHHLYDQRGREPCHVEVVGLPGKCQQRQCCKPLQIFVANIILEIMVEYVIDVLRLHLPTVQDGKHLFGQNWQTIADCLVHLYIAIIQSINQILIFQF